MWLLDTTTLELSEFLSTPPPYAILSHTWAAEEVTFQELKEISFQEVGTPEAKRKAGYRKIKKCCAQAKLDGLAYAWADTCCIDKRSSAELSEAINSMYRWYSEAQLCYAYLSDVSTLGSSEDLPNPQNQSYPRPVWGFPSSRWWQRGWTLQELIAPAHVVFFDKNWLEIGTKASLLDDILEITGIPRLALMQPLSIQDNSVAEKMSWASTRETTRVEDMAYSLLGIFGVNMPLLYGEGRKAFHRLQLQILSQSSDHSIFAWTDQRPPSITSEKIGVGVLADSPARFTIDAAGPIVRRGPDMSEINITNLGVSMALPIIQNSVGCVGILNCSRQGQRVGIQVTGEANTPRRARFHAQNLVYVEEAIIKSARSQNAYMLTEVQGLPPERGHMQIDLSLNIESQQHGLDTIYSCKSWRWSGDNVLYADANYDRRLWTSAGPEHSSSLSPLMVKDLPPVPEGEWLAVAFKGLDGNAFSLVFGPKDGRVWCHGIVGFEVLQLDKLGAPSAIQDGFELLNNQAQEEAWRYFRDRSSYKLDASRMMHVAVKLITTSPSPRYRVEVIQEQMPDTEGNIVGRE